MSKKRATGLCWHRQFLLGRSWRLPSSAYPAQPRQRRLRGMITAHAMHACTWGSGRGANIDIACRCDVVAPCRAKQKLTNVHRSASDIASYEVSVHALKVGGRKHTPCQNAFAKAGSEALDLT